MLHVLHIVQNSRPDRDTYVTIHSANVQSGMIHNFEQTAAGDTSQPYDVLSLMHYGATD